MSTTDATVKIRARKTNVRYDKGSSGRGGARPGDSNNLKFPDNLGDRSSGAEHYMLIKAYDFSDPAMTSGRMAFTAQDFSGDIELPLTPAWTWALYIPQNSLKQSYSGKYSTLDYAGALSTSLPTSDPSLTGGGGRYAGMGRGQTSESFNRINFFTDSKKRSDALSRLGDIVKEATSEGAAYLQKQMGAGGKAIQATTGAAPNSHQGMIYDGPGEFREHSFQWNLFPKNKDEAKEVKNIVANFKSSLLPGGTTTGNKGSNQIDSAYWTFPDIFTIKFYVGGSEFKRMRIFRSVLKSMSVDFGGAEGQIAFHKNGEPVGTILNLNFQETIHVTNDHISA